MFFNQKHSFGLYTKSCTVCKRRLLYEEELFNVWICDECLKENVFCKSEFIKTY